MAERRRRIAVPVLFLTVAALGYVNYELAGFSVDTTPVQISEQSTTGNPPGKDLVAGLSPKPRTLSEFPQTAARPIFFPDRRVPEKPKPKPAVVAEAKPQPALPPPVVVPPPEPLQLVGIMGAGKRKQALVKAALDPQARWITVGDEYKGWKLREILTDMAVVEASGQLSELRLYTSAAPPKR